MEKNKERMNEENKYRMNGKQNEIKKRKKKRQIRINDKIKKREKKKITKNESRKCENEFNDKCKLKRKEKHWIYREKNRREKEKRTYVKGMMGRKDSKDEKWEEFLNRKKQTARSLVRKKNELIFKQSALNVKKKWYVNIK